MTLPSWIPRRGCLCGRGQTLTQHLQSPETEPPAPHSQGRSAERQQQQRASGMEGQCWVEEGASQPCQREVAGDRAAAIKGWAL